MRFERATLAVVLILAAVLGWLGRGQFVRRPLPSPPPRPAVSGTLVPADGLGVTVNGVAPGATPEQVLAVLGPPQAKHAEPQGRKQWEYDKPAGRIFVTFEPAPRVESIVGESLERQGVVLLRRGEPAARVSQVLDSWLAPVAGSQEGKLTFAYIAPVQLGDCSPGTILWVSVRIHAGRIAYLVVNAAIHPNQP